MLDKVLGSRFLSTSSDFSDHDDAFANWIVQEHFQTVDEVGTVERITSDTNTQSLSKTSLKKCKKYNTNL